jgi:proline iminopeptidase
LELEWYYQHGASLLFPDKWERFLALIPEAERGDLISAYRRRLTDPEREVRIAAARAWSLWEGETITLMPDPALSTHFGEDSFALAFARIENHYFVHGGWLEEGQLLRGAEKLRSIPGIIVQGRHDSCTPPKAAWALKQAWPEVDLQIVPDAGHLFNEPGILDGLIRATDRFAGL